MHYAVFTLWSFLSFLKSVFHRILTQCNVCRPVIGLFVQQGKPVMCLVYDQSPSTQPWRNRNFVHLCTSYNKTSGTVFLYHHSKEYQYQKQNVLLKKTTPSLLASIASMRLFLLTFLILISNPGVETWHIKHLFRSTAFLLC